MLLYFLRSVCTIQSDAINFQPFMPSFAIFHAFNDLFWELNDLKIEKHYKWTLKKLKLGMISSFHPHIMFKEVYLLFFNRLQNDREIENHYKMNCENVETRHGIIISPA